jgi:hypothetical protein
MLVAALLVAALLVRPCVARVGSIWTETKVTPAEEDPLDPLYPLDPLPDPPKLELPCALLLL